MLRQLDDAFDVSSSDDQILAEVFKFLVLWSFNKLPGLPLTRESVHVDFAIWSIDTIFSLVTSVTYIHTLCQNVFIFYRI